MKKYLKKKNPLKYLKNHGLINNMRKYQMKKEVKNLD